MTAWQRVAWAVREWRIGWAQGQIAKAVRVLNRIDRGWQGRAYTMGMLGLAVDPQCERLFGGICNACLCNADVPGYVSGCRA